KSMQNTRPRGTMLQTKSPLESRTREQPLLKLTSYPSSRSCKTESRLKPSLSTRATSLRVKSSEIRIAPTPRTFPLLLSPKTMYSLSFVGGEAGEPSVTPGHVARTTGVHEPYVLQASSVLLSKRKKS